MKIPSTMILNTGKAVRYIGHHDDYAGKIAVAMDFDLKHRLCILQFKDGMEIPAFWDEIEEVGD